MCAFTPSKRESTLDPILLANRLAREREVARAREIMASMRKPASRSEIARAEPRFPAPTITKLGSSAMPGRIAEGSGTGRPLQRTGQCLKQMERLEKKLH